MAKTGWRSLAVAFLLTTTLATAALALPTFTDQDIAAGNLNPTDRVLVQQISVTGDTTAQTTITSVTVQNLGTAGSGQIAMIEIWDGGTQLGWTTNISGLSSGLTIPLTGYTVAAKSTHTLKIYVTVGTSVAGGETVALRVKFYYVMDGSKVSSWITDGTQETIKNGGFDSTTDTSPDAGFLNPNDNAVVQQSVFTDNDANGNNVLWTQTSSNVIVRVENLGTATTADIEKVRVTLTINGTDYSTSDTDTNNWFAWNPGSPMDFNWSDFRPDPVDIPDNSSVTVTVEMKIQDQGSVTDGRTIRTKTTLLVKEGAAGNEEEYEQSVTAGSTQTIRKQGFESIDEQSTSLVSGTVTSGSSLEQVVEVTDDDANNDDVTANAISIRNLGTAAGSEIHQIQVKAGTTTLVTITQPNALLDNFKAGMTIPFTTNKIVADDASQTIKVYYEIGTPVDGHTIRPVVKVQGNEGTDYWSDEATYPDFVTLYKPGFEIVENVSPPAGGTAYSGQRLLAQKIHLEDLDENNDDVRISPVVVKNVGTAQENPDVTKIEIWRKDSDTSTELLLGETTDLTGFRTGGVTIPTLQNNVVVDKPAGSETYLYIYVTIAGPDDMVAGRTLKLQTRVLHTENQASYDKQATGDLWTLAINHRPVVDFAYAPAAPTYEDTITFTSTVTDPDSDAITGYAWDFDDGDTSTSQNPTHTYPRGGTFDVTLTATDARGVTGTHTETVTVEGPPNEAPTATFSWTPIAPDTGEQVTFTATVTDPDQPAGTAFGYAWSFGDTTTSQTATPSHSFAEKKSYTITLTVTDDAGADVTVTKTLSVGNEPPVARFTAAPNPATVGQPVAFNSDDSDDPDTDGSVEGWAWDFADGTAASTEQNPTHTYAVAGTYTVSLVVTDDKGTDSVAATVDVTVNGPAQTVLYSFPNPAATQASIVYYLPTGATAPVLHIYDITGALVHEQALDLGASPYLWNLQSDAGVDMPNGLYLCIVTAQGANNSAIYKLLIER